MKKFKKILVSIDDRFEDDPALDWAIELAEQCQAQLHVVDILPNLNWAHRLTEKSSLNAAKEVRSRKESWLASIADRARKKGIMTSTSVEVGKSSSRLIEMVAEQHFDLIVRTTRGKFSSSSGFFGRTSMRLLRHCPSAVWLIKPGTRPHFSKVLAAVDLESTLVGAVPVANQSTSLDHGLLELAVSIAQSHSGQCHAVHAWELFGSNLLQSRMDEVEFEELLKNYRDDLKKRMAQLADESGLRANIDQTHLIHGSAASVIPELILRDKMDLLIMGTHTRTGLTNLVIGNTAEQILDRIQCSLLAIKPGKES